MGFGTFVNVLRVANALSGQPDTVSNAGYDAVDTLDAKVVEVNTGYNALETGITSERELKARALTDASINVGKAELGYFGLNETVGGLKNYFGLHKPYLGWNDNDLQLVGLIKTSSNGIEDAKAGLRYKMTDKLGVDYGWIDVTFDNVSGNAMVFLGKEIGDKTSVGLFVDAEKPFNGKPEVYTELQLNRKLTNKLSGYLRAEKYGIGFKDTYIVGGLSFQIGK